MGGGSWTTSSYVTYSTIAGKKVSANGVLDASYHVQDLYKAVRMDESLKPYNVVRECRDTEEHPNTIPVILALDVTGSMGSSLEKVQRKLNEIMNNLYEQAEDVEFMIMGIGDLAYDGAPIQASQFESDVRIAEWLDKIYFERGGGGNGYESYTAAWYFGSRHTDLDCWKRGKKGIIITLGDEPLNPYLPKNRLEQVTGDHLQADIETDALYKEVTDKYDVYHLAVNDPGNCYRMYKSDIDRTYSKYLDKNHFFVVNLDNIASRILEIVLNSDCYDVKESDENLTKTEIIW